MRYSSQREAVWDCLKDRHDHPTAEQLYQAVSQQMPGIGIATVYRNLAALVEQGRAHTVDVGDGSLHYDPLTSEHYHFMCQSCGRVIDVMPNTEGFSSLPVRIPGIGSVESHALTLYGTCDDCKKKQDKAV